MARSHGIFEPGTSLDTFPCTYGDCEGPHLDPGVEDAHRSGRPDPDSDPVIQQIRRGLTEFRGAYYQDEGWASR